MGVKFKIFFLLLFCLLLVKPCYPDQKKPFWSKLSFKLTAGWGSDIPMGDINDCLESVNRNETFEFWRKTSPDRVVGEIKKLDNRASHWEMELRFDLTARIGIAMSTSGPFDRHNESSVIYTKIGYYGPHITTLTYKPRVKVLPIRLSVYYSPLAISRASILISAGIGFYPAKMEQSLNYKMKSPFGEGWHVLDWEARRQFSLGFHGGVGAEIRLLRSLALVIEYQRRHVRISGFKGTMTWTDNAGNQYEWKGTLYYYKEFDENIVAKYARLEVYDEPPIYGVGPPTDVREASLDLSGHSLQIGIRLIFF